MSAASLLLNLLAFVLAGWALWHLALRLAPAWLRRGEGPLWILSSAMPCGLAVAALVMGVSAPWVQFLQFGATADDGFHWLLVGTLGGLITYAVLRLVLGLTRESWAVWRSFFLAVGILPDSTTLRDLHGTAKYSTVFALWLIIIIGCLSQSAHLGDLYPILWGLATAAMTCMWLAFIHPIIRSGELVRVTVDEIHKTVDPIEMRAQPLLQWLGAKGPVVVERREFKSEDASRAVHFGYQERTLKDANKDSHIAITGPVGAGKSTLAFLIAADHIVGTGATSVFIVASPLAARNLAAVIRRAQEFWVEAGVLTVTSGADPASADIWIATSTQVADYLDLRCGDRDETRDRFLARLGCICFDDIGAFAGPSMLEQRYLLFRMFASVGLERELKTLLVGCLADASMKQASEHIAATDKIRLVSVWHEDLDSTRSVIRYMFAYSGVDWGRFKFTAGMDALRSGVTTFSNPSGNEDAAFSVDFYESGRARESLGDTSSLANDDTGSDVAVIKVAGSNAWELLARGRKYYDHGGDGDPALEILTFADDPMSRWLECNWKSARETWPEELLVDRYPRVLASLPGHGLLARGALVRARHHLRAAMADGPQALTRLEGVFSPKVVKELVEESGDQAETMTIWRPADGVASSPGYIVAEALRLRGPVGVITRDIGTEAELHDPSTGRTWRLPDGIVNYEAPIGGVVELEGSRYEVMRDDLNPRNRTLRAVVDSRRTAAIRDLSFSLVVGRSEPREFRFGGWRCVRSQRAQVRVHLTQTGVHVFEDVVENGVSKLLRKSTETFREPVRDDRLLTEAWIVWLDGANSVTIHTLAHIVRDSLDYFFMGGSGYIGVCSQSDLNEKPALVFYERAIGGNGCLETIDDREDLRNILRCAFRILYTCPGNRPVETSHACGICCRSVACSFQKHNDQLDSPATAEWLSGFFRSSG